MNKLKPSNENFIALESCILNNKTLKEAFNEFSQGDYTFNQVKRFYYKYKEELEEADKNITYCENCKKNFIKGKKITVNKYSHSGIRRIIDAIFTLGTSESFTYLAYICPNCKTLTVIDFNMKL